MVDDIALSTNNVTVSAAEISHSANDEVPIDNLFLTGLVDYLPTLGLDLTLMVAPKISQLMLYSQLANDTHWLHNHKNK